MVDPALVTAARTSSGRRDGLLADSVPAGLQGAGHGQWEAAWKKEYPNAPAGRPNNFDLLAYGDMYVLAEGMERAGKNLTTDSLIKGARGHPELSRRPRCDTTHVLDQASHRQPGARADAW